MGKYIIAVPLYSTVNFKYTAVSGTYFLFTWICNWPKNRQRLMSLGTALNFGQRRLPGYSTAILKHSRIGVSSDIYVKKT